MALKPSDERIHSEVTKQSQGEESRESNKSHESANKPEIETQNASSQPAEISTVSTKTVPTPTVASMIPTYAYQPFSPYPLYEHNFASIPLAPFRYNIEPLSPVYSQFHSQVRLFQQFD